jgi:ElaB/YqjD/DUF883 family membrane-anchored ribosome-binding protein
MSSDNPGGSPGGVSSTPIPAQAERDLTKVAETAQHDLEAIKRQAADDVRELGKEAGAKVGEVKEKAKSFAVEQKDFAAGQIGGIASAIGKVADELDGSDQPVVGRYARDLASGLTNLGKTIENRDVDDLMGLAQDFGRKQPLAFLGAAALAGFVASRFALASSHRLESKSSMVNSTGGAQNRGGMEPGSTSYSGGNPGRTQPGSSYGSGQTGSSGTGMQGGSGMGSESYRSETSQATQNTQTDRKGGL